MCLRKMYLILIALVGLAACSGPAPASAPTVAPPQPAAERAPTAPALAGQPTPTMAPTAVPSPTTATTVAPTKAPAPTAAPTAAPTTAPTELPTPAAPAAAALPEQPLDPSAQAGALLPQFAGDLARAGEWNRYTISAAIDPQARTIAGRLRLEYTNRDNVSLDRLYFHLYPNLQDFGGQSTVSNLQVNGASVPVAYEGRRYLLRVNLPQPLNPGLTTTVTLDWTATAPENAGKRLFGAFNKEHGVLALSSAYPTVAVVRGGNWDIAVPDAKGDFVVSETALYDVTLAAPDGWSLATTGVTIGQQTSGGQQVARIVSGPQRDFMITLSQFKLASAEVDGTRVNSWYRPDHEAGGQAALRAAATALQVFNKRYGLYPFVELDVVEVVAGNFLGDEFPGLVVMQEDLYVDQNGLEVTVAHEVAHQWWYSQVGNDVQAASWLDEALASYSQIVYQEETNGPAAAERELDEFRRRYATAVSSGRDAPVDQPTRAFVRNYVLIVYGKAVLFFQALRKQIGEEAFDRFLRNHYANHRYGFTTGEDLLADAQGACGCDVRPLYEAWITKVAPVEVP